MTISIFLAHSLCDRNRAWVYNSAGASYDVWNSELSFSKIRYQNQTVFIPKPTVTSWLSYNSEMDELSLSIKVEKVHSKNRNRHGNPFTTKEQKKNKNILYRSFKFILTESNDWNLECFWSKNDEEKIEGICVQCGHLNTPINQFLIADNWKDSLPIALQQSSKDAIIEALCIF
jgi:hypothetical protein